MLGAQETSPPDSLQCGSSLADSPPAVLRDWFLETRPNPKCSLCPTLEGWLHRETHAPLLGSRGWWGFLLRPEHVSAFPLPGGVPGVPRGSRQ